MKVKYIGSGKLKTEFYIYSYDGTLKLALVMRSFNRKMQALVLQTFRKIRRSLAWTASNYFLSVYKKYSFSWLACHSCLIVLNDTKKIKVTNYRLRQINRHCEKF